MSNPSMTAAGRIKAQLANNETATGVLMQLPSPQAAAALTKTNIDWLWIDMEHGAINIETAHQMIMATKGTDVAPIVRVPWNQHWLVKPLLDCGAMGIVTPQVNSAAEARVAVDALRYPPLGQRGFGGVGLASAHWGMSTQEYVTAADRDILAIIQIEHIDAVNNIDEIVKIQGIDVLLIGGYDLSGSMGFARQPGHPEVQAAIETVRQAAKSAGIPLGIFATQTADILRYKEQGFQFLACGIDLTLLTDQVTRLLTDIE